MFRKFMKLFVAAFVLVFGLLYIHALAVQSGGDSILPRILPHNQPEHHVRIEYSYR